MTQKDTFLTNDKKRHFLAFKMTKTDTFFNSKSPKKDTFKLKLFKEASFLTQINKKTLCNEGDFVSCTFTAYPLIIH